MERYESTFDYSDSGYEECEQLQWSLQFYYHIESEIEYYDEYMVLVWYE